LQQKEEKVSGTLSPCRRAPGGRHEVSLAPPRPAETRAGAGCGGVIAWGPGRDVGAGPRRAQTHAEAASLGGHGAAATQGRKVVATKITGSVKWYNAKNNYGFITRDDTGEDLFVHRTAIKRNNPKNYLQSVGDGEVVQFDIVILIVRQLWHMQTSLYVYYNLLICC
uniref:Uncharacterized protein n=1 Tax=Corvus moneduloides TaxID=1196302 RepID=A0A8C3EV12_CORMO